MVDAVSAAHVRQDSSASQRSSDTVLQHQSSRSELNSSAQQPAQHTLVPPPVELGRFSACFDKQGRQVPLGKGAIGSTWRYRDTQTGQQVVIKRVQLTNVPAHRRLLLGHHICAEVLNHSALRHPHVIRLHAVFLTSNHLNLVMEYANSGSLLDLVNERGAERGGLLEADARWLFQQLVLALDYCHAKNVAHRDVKLENLLLVSSPGAPKPLVKLADFGCSKYGASEATSVLGTSCYMSSEMLQAAATKGPARTCYDPRKADVWAAGVVLMMLLTARYPFTTPQPGASCKQQLQVLKNSIELPSHVSSSCKHLLRKLLTTNPAKRITVDGIKKHPWFLKDLPPGALDMTSTFVMAPSQCWQSRDQLDTELHAALEMLTTR